MIDKRWLIAFLTLFALEMQAQPQTWDKVKAIPLGTQVRLTGPRPDPIIGKLERATDESLMLTLTASQETFTRAQITRVSTKGPGHRARNTLLGLGLGAGAGLAVGAGTDQSCGPHCFLGNNLGKEIFTPLGAIVGALIGLVIPTGRWHEIYKQ